ncbi:MAG: hypothetical protein DMG06_23870, partial [Acidobacteria bacterium]
PSRCAFQLGTSTTLGVAFSNQMVIARNEPLVIAALKIQGAPKTDSRKSPSRSDFLGIGTLDVD